MYAIIIAGGEGTRLRPYTLHRPKAMVEVGGKPLLEHQIEQLKKAGINNVMILENYKSEVVQDYFGDGSKWGIKIHHVLDKEPEKHEQTSKLVRDTLQQIPESENDILVMLGDNLSTIDLKDLLDKHTEENNLVTLYGTEYKFPDGIVKFDEATHSTEVTQKPSLLIYGGIAAIKRDIISQLEQDKPFSTVVNKIEGKTGVYTDKSAKYWHISEVRDDVQRTDKELWEARINKEQEGYRRSGEIL